MPNAITIDLEDWYHGIEQPAARFEERIHIGAERTLAILNEAGVKATFFVLGRLAERHPELVERIAAAGHEIGSHGWDHTKLYTMTPHAYRAALARAKQVTEDAAGQPILGHRAAFFSITRRTLWAVDILAELGFTFDSSIYPGKNWRYGIPGSPLGIYLLGDSGVVEFPVSTVSLGVRRVGLGGAYFRILPYWITRWGLRRINAQGRPAMIYLHPWELDPAHPRARFCWKAMLTHYFNLRATAPRLRRLLREERFTRMGDVIAAQGTLHRVAPGEL